MSEISRLRLGGKQFKIRPEGGGMAQRVARFVLQLEGWRSASKPVKVHELARAFSWPAGCYQDLGDMDASFSPHGKPGNLHLLLAGTSPLKPVALRQRWNKELSRLARWLDEQSPDVVSRAASSQMRLSVVVEVWSPIGQPDIELGKSVLAAAARLKLPIRIVLHLGEDAA